MKKVAFSSKWLDDSNGLVKDCSNEFMEQNESTTQKLAKPSISAAGLLARMAKGVVSFLQNLLSPLTRKEGVRTDQEVFRLREVSQTTAIGALYGLLFAGLLLLPFQPHRAIVAAPPAEETVETQAIPLIPILIKIGWGAAGSIVGWAAIRGTEYIIEESKTPNGTVVAVADLVVESESVKSHWWYTGDFFEDTPYVDKGAMAQERNYEYYMVNSVWIYWNEENERYESNGDSRYYHGNIYLPTAINNAYNNGRPGDAETGKQGFFAESGRTADVDVLHAFDSSVDESSKDDLLADQGEWTYTPRAYAYVSDMRHEIINYEEDVHGYSGTGPRWKYTPRSEPIKATATTMSAEEDIYQTVQVLTWNTRLDRVVMYKNKSKVYWDRESRTLLGGSTVDGKWEDGREGKWELPHDFEGKTPVPKQKITDHN